VPAPDTALLFHPDGFDTTRDKLMGRHVAGASLLRALASRGRLTGTGADAHRDAFERMVTGWGATPAWIGAADLLSLSRLGCLTIPGPDIADEARRRLKAGIAAYSIVGVTHTTASHTALDSIAGVLADPVMPWDALIATSASVADTVAVVLDAQADYWRWRFADRMPERPRVPVIPLGVHASDWSTDEETRAQARRRLGLAGDEVAVLFVGRLSFHAKANPYPLYVALESVARRTGAKLAFVQCGWFANESIEQAFRDGAARYAPSVRAVFADGRDVDLRADCWRAADIFASLSDNIQETFGLTPLEAMAAGLPVIATDWNGYRDTVRDGVDGFLVPTRMPGPSFGMRLADQYAFGLLSYDAYVGTVAATVSLDFGVLEDRLGRLVQDAGLRAAMGQEGRRKVAAAYDWSIVIRRYEALWAELGAIRQSQPLRAQTQPLTLAARGDPYQLFRSYPTSRVNGLSEAALRPGAPEPALGHPLFSAARAIDSDLAAASRAILQELSSGETLSLDAIAARSGLAVERVVNLACILAKALLIELRPPGTTRDRT
jgi:glycosyltransferase involved in cell wall biosynthesis